MANSKKDEKQDERIFKTPKGTELPFVMLEKNKKDKKTGQWIAIPPQPYLTVPHRIIWFREEKPNWTIRTTILEHTKDHTYARAEILDESGRLLAMGHKREDIQGFQDHLEKSETGSVGRALAMLGYGTAFALELEEGDRLADAPVTEKTKPQEAERRVNKVGEGRPSIQDLAKWIVPVGQFKNQALQSIDPSLLGSELERATKFLSDHPKAKDAAVLTELIDMGTRYLNFYKETPSEPSRPASVPNHAPEAQP